MNDETLEIITSLIDRIEALESTVQAQQKIIDRWERLHLPTEEEAIDRIKNRLTVNQPAVPSHEECYILVWGAKKFEAVYRTPADPYLEKLRASGMI